MILISTHSGLYAADSSGECECWARGYYYGLAVLDDRVVAARRIERNTKTSPTVLEVYSLNGLRLEEPEFDGHWLIDTHQATATDHGIYFTDTGHNRVWFCSLDEDWDHGFIDISDGTFNHKVNSVLPDGEGRVWMVLHNQGLKESEVLVFSHSPDRWEVIHRIELAHKGVHNVESREGVLWYNASEDSSVVRVEPNGRASSAEIEGNWHTKGMAWDDGRLLCGFSEHKVTLAQRFVSRSGLLWLNPATMEPGEPVPLQWRGQTVGNVNEVRVVE